MKYVLIKRNKQTICVGSNEHLHLSGLKRRPFFQLMATREKGRQKKNIACIGKLRHSLVATLPQRVKTDDYFRNGVVFVLPQKNTKEEPVHIHLQHGQKVRLWNHDLPEEVYIIWAISRPSNGTPFDTDELVQNLAVTVLRV